MRSSGAAAFDYAFRQLSEATQKTTRYAGGDKTLYKNHLTKYNRGVQPLLSKRKGDFMANTNYELAHTKWMCKYHIVFTPICKRVLAIRRSPLPRLQRNSIFRKAMYPAYSKQEPVQL